MGKHLVRPWCCRSTTLVQVEIERVDRANGRAFKMVFKKMLESTHRKTKESLKSVLMRLCQPETSFFEPTVSVRINVCSDEILSWLLMFWCLELMPVLDRPSECAIQIRQAARQAFVESQDDKAMRRALVARPRP